MSNTDRPTDARPFDANQIDRDYYEQIRPDGSGAQLPQPGAEQTGGYPSADGQAPVGYGRSTAYEAHEIPPGPGSPPPEQNPPELGHYPQATAPGAYDPANGYGESGFSAGQAPGDWHGGPAFENSPAQLTGDGLSQYPAESVPPVPELSLASGPATAESHFETGGPHLRGGAYDDVPGLPQHTLPSLGAAEPGNDYLPNADASYDPRANGQPNYAQDQFTQAYPSDVRDPGNQWGGADQSAGQNYGENLSLDSYQTQPPAAPAPYDTVPDPQFAGASFAPSDHYGEAGSYSAASEQLGAEPEFGAPTYVQQSDGSGQGAVQPYDPIAGGDHAAAGEAFDDDEFEDDADEGSRSGRIVAIAASMLLAVAVGGGVAYGYSQFIAKPSVAPGNPVIRAKTDKAKETPATPGGKVFAHKDSKLLGRLDSGGQSGSTTAARTQAAADRVRRVSTHVVRPDGSLVPAKPNAAAVQARAAAAARQARAAAAARQNPQVPRTSGPNPAAAIPGLVIEGIGGRAPQSAPQRPAPTRVAAAPVVRPPAAATPRQVPPAVTRPATGSPQVPVVITRARTAPAAVVTPTDVARVAAPASAGGVRGIPLPARNTFPRRRAVSPPASVQTAAIAPRAPAAAPAATTGTAARGYGVVLASQNSRIEALQTFADLRQRYANALGNKIPDVQKADLSARGLGTVYRLVVGPPASRAAANQLCNRLRSAGYNDCWVKAY